MPQGRSGGPVGHLHAVLLRTPLVGHRRIRQRTNPSRPRGQHCAVRSDLAALPEILDNHHLPHRHRRVGRTPRRPDARRGRARPSSAHRDCGFHRRAVVSDASPPAAQRRTAPRTAPPGPTMTTRTCVTCASPITVTTRNPNRRFCSPRCRAADWHARNRTTTLSTAPTTLPTPFTRPTPFTTPFGPPPA